jgi:hypothetical protein
VSALRAVPSAGDDALEGAELAVPVATSPGAASGATEKKVTACIAMSFRPFGGLVSAIAQLVDEFCRIQLGDADLSYRFRMAAHELAENLVKFSTKSPVHFDIELFESNCQRRLRVKTRNTTTPERLREVERRFAELKQAPDAMEHYVAMIRRTAPLEGVSGLGLVRIRAEGEFDIDYRIVGDELTLIVEAAVPGTPGPDARS